MLIRHNAFRRAHGVPPLTLDSKVENDLENMLRMSVTPSLIINNTKLKWQNDEKRCPVSEMCVTY